MVVNIISITLILAFIQSLHGKVLIYNSFVCNSLVDLVNIRPLIFKSTVIDFDQFTIDAWINIPTIVNNDTGLLVIFMSSNQNIQLIINPEHQLFIKTCFCYSSTDCSLLCTLSLTSLFLSNLNPEYIVLSIKIQNYDINYSLSITGAEILFQGVNTSNTIINSDVYSVMFGDLSTTGQPICNKVTYNRVQYYNNYFDSIADFIYLNQNGPGTLRVLLLPKLHLPMNEALMNIAPDNNSYFAIVKSVSNGFSTTGKDSANNLVFDFNRYILMNNYIIPDNSMDKSYMVGIRYDIKQNPNSQGYSLANSSFDVGLYARLNSDTVYNTTSNANALIFLILNMRNMYDYLNEIYYIKPVDYSTNASYNYSSMFPSSTSSHSRFGVVQVKNQIWVNNQMSVNVYINNNSIGDQRAVHGISDSDIHTCGLNTVYVNPSIQFEFYNSIVLVELMVIHGLYSNLLINSTSVSINNHFQSFELYKSDFSNSKRFVDDNYNWFLWSDYNYNINSFNIPDYFINYLVSLSNITENVLNCIQWINGICTLCKFNYVLKNTLCDITAIDTQYDLFTKKTIPLYTLNIIEFNLSNLTSLSSIAYKSLPSNYYNCSFNFEFQYSLNNYYFYQNFTFFREYSDMHTPTNDYLSNLKSNFIGKLNSISLAFMAITTVSLSDRSHHQIILLITIIPYLANLS